MMIKIDASSLGDTKWHEYLIRFLFGGAVTVAVGFVAHRWGPVIAGLFLAFPAIFPASATLIQSHQAEKQRGIDAAGADAMGAASGSLGLALFAVVDWIFLPAHSPVLVLAGATLLWFAASCGIWVLWKHHRRGW